MKMSKRIAAMVLCLVLIISAFAGCGASGEQPDAASSSPASTAASSSADKPSENAEQLELSVALWDLQDGFNKEGAANDTIFNDLCKKLNITIKPIQMSWNDWNDKLQIWASSNQMPDITSGLLTSSLYNTLSKQGVLKAIPDDLNKYPNLQYELSLDSLQAKKVEGKFYMIPRGDMLNKDAPNMSRPIIYRKDWAEQAGFTEAPGTFDEYVAMVKAVQKQHPDAAGLSVNTKWYLGTVFLWSFPEASVDSAWVQENGSWIPVYASEKMYDGIKQLRQLYTDGILDKDFVIQKDADGVVKFQNGKSFSMFCGTNFQPTKFIEANPDATIEKSVGYMVPFVAPDGNRYTPNGLPYWSETYLSNKIDDKKLDRALQLLDYVSGEEYTVLKSNGIENVDWKMENGNAISLMSGDQTIQTKYPITDKFGWLGSWGVVTAASDKKVYSANAPTAQFDKLFNADYYNALKEHARPVPVNFDVWQLSTPAKDKADTLRNEAMDNLVKVIVGKDDPVKMWKEAIKGFDSKGLPEAIKETNAKAAEMGIK